MKHEPYRGSRRELADLITSVQEHPLTPPVLKDNITEALVGVHHQMDFTATPEGVDLCLVSYEREADVLTRAFTGERP